MFTQRVVFIPLSCGFSIWKIIMLDYILKKGEKKLLCCCYSVVQPCHILCDPMDCNTPGFPVLYHLPELAKTHVHWVSDAIQPSHVLSSPFSFRPQSFLSIHISILQCSANSHIHRWPLEKPQPSCMDVRVGLWRKLSAEELMLLKCGVGEDSWESNQSSLGVHWKEWC